jgi:hypothetical protein
LAGKIYRFGKGLEQDFDNVMGFFPVEQLQMQVATCVICETLEEFTRQPKPKSTRHVLLLFLFADPFELQFVQAAPDQAGSAAEIDDAPGEAFIHRNMRFTSERVSRIKACAVATNAFLVPQGFTERLSKRDAAVFNGVMRIDFQVTIATQSKIHHRMLRKECQHVIEERNACLDRGLALPIDLQVERDAGFFCDPPHLRLALQHLAQLTRPYLENKAQILFQQNLGAVFVRRNADKSRG